MANDIGLSKSRRGWIYPLVGFFVAGEALGAWLGVLLVKLRSPAPGFFPSTEPLYLSPLDRAVFQEDTPRPPAEVAPRREAYEIPERCPACNGLVPPGAPVCGHCGHPLVDTT
jgi:hypothetical protein